MHRSVSPAAASFLRSCSRRLSRSLGHLAHCGWRLVRRRVCFAILRECARRLWLSIWRWRAEVLRSFWAPLWVRDWRWLFGRVRVRQKAVSVRFIVRCNGWQRSVVVALKTRQLAPRPDALRSPSLRPCPPPHKKLRRNAYHFAKQRRWHRCAIGANI